MSSIIVKLDKDDLEWLLLGGTVTSELTIHNYDNLQSVDIELDRYNSSTSAEEED